MPKEAYRDTFVYYLAFLLTTLTVDTGQGKSSLTWRGKQAEDNFCADKDNETDPVHLIP